MKKKTNYKPIIIWIVLKIEWIKCIIWNTIDYYSRFYRIIRLDNWKRFFASNRQLQNYL